MEESIEISEEKIKLLTLALMGFMIGFMVMDLLTLYRERQRAISNAINYQDYRLSTFNSRIEKLEQKKTPAEIAEVQVEHGDKATLS